MLAMEISRLIDYERTANGVVSIDLCLYTIRTRHAEIERCSSANGTTASLLKRTR